MIYDIRAKDKVRLKNNLTEEQIIKLKKFINAKINAGDSARFSGAIKVDRLFNCNLEVISVSKSRKTNTEFALVSVTDGDFAGINTKIQTRYLKVVQKHRAHPCTSIFL